MSDASAILSLPFIQPSQAQKHVTHNEALKVLDAIVQLAVMDRSLTTPPTLASIGDRYIVPQAATGAWAGKTNDVAVFDGASWIFLTPLPGWHAEVISESEEVVFDEVSGWQTGVQRPFSASRLGISATADATNRLTVSSDATLLNNAGSGHQLKINKSLMGDTASMMFQTGYSGRAEIGLAGNDDLSIKVSDDGGTWSTGLSISADSGTVTFAQDVMISGQVQGDAVMQSATDVTTGRLMRADFGYCPGNLLGSVSQSGAVPTGAVLERGSNADGEYLKLADGTLICTSPAFVGDATTPIGGLFRWAAGQTWSFPEAFFTAPHVMPGATHDPALCWATAQTATATSAIVNLFSATSATGCSAQYVAIGRRFWSIRLLRSTSVPKKGPVERFAF